MNFCLCFESVCVNFKEILSKNLTCKIFAQSIKIYEIKPNEIKTKPVHISENLDTHLFNHCVPSRGR